MQYGTVSKQYVTQFWKTDQVVTNSISSNNDFKY